MSEQEDNTDKPYDPTPRKLEDARKKGEIPRSADLNTSAAYTGLLLVIITAGDNIVTGLGDTFFILFEQPDSLLLLISNGTGSPLFGQLALSITLSTLPLFLIPALAVMLMLSGLRGFTFVPTKLAAKAHRISPVSNAKNKYGRTGLFEFAKSFAKLLIYSICLALYLHARLPDLAELLYSAPGPALSRIAGLVTEFLVLAVLISLSIGIFDYLFQHKEHLRKNRMSYKDMRDEMKESEGDPFLKQERRQRAQTAALNQMMSDVPEADVVMVNPTHYAVALKWARQPGEAPVCVAKGVDKLAHRICELAREHGVPVHRDPPAARSLHALVEIGQEIHPAHYASVAAAIRFSEEMRRRTKGFA